MIHMLKTSRYSNPKEQKAVEALFKWQGLGLSSSSDDAAVLNATGGHHGCVLFKGDKAVAIGFLEVVEYIKEEGIIRC